MTLSDEYMEAPYKIIFVFSLVKSEGQNHTNPTWEPPSSPLYLSNTPRVIPLDLGTWILEKKYESLSSHPFSTAV
jgi:hypothetical protein